MYRRFPIVKALRTDFELSQKIIVATACLFNLGRQLDDELTDGEDEEEDEDIADGVRVEDNSDVNEVRLRGQAER